MHTSLLLASALLLQSQPMTADAIGVLRHPSAVRGLVCTNDTAYVLRDDGWVAPYALETRKSETGIRFPGEGVAIAMDARQEYLAVAYGFSHVGLVDRKTMNVTKILPLEGAPERLVFAPDGKSLVVALMDGNLVQLGVPQLDEIRRTIPTQNSRIIALAAAPTGKTIATSDREGKICLIDATTLATQKSWEASDQHVTALTFDSSGNLLGSGDQSGEVKMWDVRRQTAVSSDKTFHRQLIKCISFLKGGIVVTGGHDGLSQFWNSILLDNGNSYPDYRGFINASATSPDGRWLVRGGSYLDFVPAESPDKFHRVAEYGGAITSVVVDKEAKRIATAGVDQRLMLWTIEDQIKVAGIKADQPISGIGFCNAGRSIAIGLANGEIEIYSIGNLAKERSWKAHDASITGIAAENDVLASIADDGSIKVWDTSGNLKHSTSQRGPCRCVTLTRSALAVGTVEGKIFLFDVTKELAAIPLPGRPLTVTCVKLSTNGHSVLVGYMDGMIEHFDLQSLRRLSRWKGDGSSVLSLDCNDYGSVIAGFRDGTVVGYDTVDASTRKSIVPIGRHEQRCVAWLFGERTFVAAGGSNSATLFKIGSGSTVSSKKAR